MEDLDKIEPLNSRLNQKGKISIFYYTLSVLSLSISQFLFKFFNSIMPNYNFFGVSFTRFLITGLVNNYFENKYEVKTIVHGEHKKLIILRSISLLLGFSFLVHSFLFLSYSTCISIYLSNPVILNLLAFIILKEPFHLRYLVGILITFLGAIMITLSDKTELNDKSIVFSNLSLFVGFILVTLASISTSFEDLFAKMLSGHYSCYYLNKIIGYQIAGYSLILCIFNPDQLFPTLFNLEIFLLTLVSTIFNIIAFNLMIISFKKIEVTKVSMINYIMIVFACLMGYFFLGEKFSIFQFVGIFFILIPNAYNFIYPLKN